MIRPDKTTQFGDKVCYMRRKVIRTLHDMTLLSVRENDVAHDSVVSDGMPRYSSPRVEMACRVFAGKGKDATVIQTTSVTITILSECQHNSKRARCDLLARHSDNRLKYHQENKTLKFLNLEGNSFSHEGASALAEALKATLVIRTASFSPESCC